MSLVDPRSLVGCACPRIGALDCAHFRSGDDLRMLIDGGDWYTEGDGCECDCHRYDAADEDDDQGDRAGP